MHRAQFSQTQQSLAKSTCGVDRDEIHWLVLVMKPLYKDGFNENRSLSLGIVPHPLIVETRKLHFTGNWTEAFELSVWKDRLQNRHWCLTCWTHNTFRLYWTCVRLQTNWYGDDFTLIFPCILPSSNAADNTSQNQLSSVFVPWSPREKISIGCKDTRLRTSDPKVCVPNAGQTSIWH